MVKWHVSKGEVSIGPLAEEALVARIQSGEFPKASLVWRKGMKTWEPIEVHFAKALNLADEKKSVARHVVISEAPPAVSESKPLVTLENRLNPVEKGWIKYAMAAAALFFIFFVRPFNSPAQGGA